MESPLRLIHHSEDALWVEDASCVTVGSTVTQTKYVGSHQDLEHAFVHAWRERWMRHADVPPDRWECIIQFAKRFMPRLNLHWESMRSQDIKRMVRTKKRSTSSGFDGVSLADLRAMPDPVVQAFGDMFQCAERKGEWPSQLVDGRVVSLAKVASPASPADFRPITVFGLLYRVWSSFHSRQALRLMDEALPETLYGSRPGRYAAQVWAKLLWSIEHSFEHSVELTGLVADLQKAFNMIPRLVVFELAGHIGMPGGMLVAWAGALSQMQRRFLLRGSLTAGVPSVTGFPEGCGLSCVAMVIIDFAFHLWQRTFFPLCTALSYVDDWQLLCPHGSLMEGAKRCLDLFVNAVDLQLDGKKTYAWSLTAEGRQSLRRGGFRVVLAAKNLGAHVQVSKKHTNFTLVDRISGVAAIWPRLRISACKYRLKIRAILVAAWPRALHAVASTQVGDAVVHSLRTGALRGLDADGSGCNAWVHLGLVEHPLVDPGFWSIIHTIRCARDCGDPLQVCAALVKLTRTPDAMPSNSITSTLISRLQTLTWHVDDNGWIHDQYGKFSLFDACMGEIVLRAQWAWQKVVAEQVAHRPGFRDLQFVDAADTRAFLKTLAPDDQELFHKCLNGTHITQDSKMYCQEGGSDLCPYCDCTDSRFHRFWVCERFQSERDGVPDDILALIPTLPDVVTGYGWSVKPYTSLEWYRQLNEISVESVNPLQDLQKSVHLFTDGSCINPAIPMCRLAAWAVVFADVTGPVAGSVVDSGPLPGILQNSYRAEIFAVWRALSLLRLQSGRIFLWTDSGAVVTRMRRLLQGGEPKPNGAHSDLWLLIFDTLRDFASGQVEIRKVAAHQRVANAVSPVEDWCTIHNTFADHAANFAQWRRPASFWEFFDRHVQATRACNRISREVQHVLLRISRAVVRDNSGPEGIEREEVCVPPEVPSDAWKALDALYIPATAVRWYGDEVVRLLLSWYWQATYSSSSPVIWMSQFQLYIDFMMSGEHGPTKLGVWRAGHRTPQLDLLSIPFQTRCRWFSRVLKECLKHHGQTFTYRYCRPHSRSLFLHTGCIAVPWDPVRVSAVDDWILAFCPNGVQRTSKAVDGLPFATKDCRFPEVLVSMV